LPYPLQQPAPPIKNKAALTSPGRSFGQIMPNPTAPLAHPPGDERSARG
jgi:hypothetical protein